MSTYELFEAHNEEYLKFDRIENKRSMRSDLHAFMLLDELFPSKVDLICAAEHDIYYLNIGDYDLSELTEDNIIELIRCGIHYDSGLDSLASFA